MKDLVQEKEVKEIYASAKICSPAAVKGTGLTWRAYNIFVPMIKEAEALSPSKLGNHVENLESEQSETGSWRRSPKKYSSRKVVAYLLNI